MDKKLLDALNNLASALDYLTDSMAESSKEKSKSPTSTALTSTKLEKKIEALNKGVKEVQSDSKKILKNQQELIQIAKEQQAQQQAGGPVGDASDPKQKNRVKDGLQTIMMIAVGVLAIGLAFKLVGSLNFVSVIALALALPLVAMAFEKIAQMKDLKPSQIGDVLLVTLAIAAAITFSSWILSLVIPISLPKLITIVLIGAAFAVLANHLPLLIKGFEKVSITGAIKFAVFGPLTLLAVSTAITISSWVLQYVMPVGIAKLFTVIMIAAAFSVVAMGLPKMLQAFNKVNVGGATKMILFGPLVLLAISTAIMLSSYVLQFVMPVGIAKLFTVILIAAAFAVLAFGLPKILEGFSKMKVDPAKAAIMSILMPIVFIGLAIAITAASHIFGNIVPVTFIQLLTAFLIGIVFIPLSYALPPLAKAMSKVTIKQAMLMPVVLVLMAAAIMLSSYLFNLTEYVPFMHLLNIIVQSITLAVIGIALSIAMQFVSKVSIVDAIKGGIVLIILSAVIMVSSLILALGSYENYPSLNWILGVGASLTAFTIAAVALGVLVFGPQALIVAAGAAAILILSAVIVAASYILNEGQYESYPSLLWILGVAASLGSFATLSISLGLTGLFALVGVPVMLALAYTIVEISNILASGNYNLPGFVGWAASVALLYTVFTPILLILGAVAVANAVLSAFGANPMEMASGMIIDIAETIVEVAAVLSKGNFTGGPTWEWAGGVAIALGAFSPIYSMLVANKVFEAFGGGGVGPNEFNQAIRTVVGGIIFASDAFVGFSEKDYPRKEWSEGVGLAIGAFAPVYDILSKSKGYWSSGITVEQFNEAIMTTVGGIVAAAEYFGKNIAVFDLEKVPKKEWGEAVGGAIKAFMPALEFITKNASMWTGADTNIIKKAIVATAEAIRDSSLIFKEGDYEGGIKKEWVSEASSSIKSFVSLAEWVREKKDIKKSVKSLIDISKSIRDTANILAEGEYEKTVNSEWMTTVETSILRYISLALIVSSIAGLEDDYTPPSASFSLTTGVSASLGGTKKGALSKLAGVTRSILDTSKVFSQIAENMQNVDSNWMSNVSDNVMYYVELARWLTDNDVESNIVDNAVTGMRNLAFGYSELAKAIEGLSSSMENLDTEKLNAIKSLNSSVVLVSLMDPDQFSSMMDELEDRGGILLDALQSVDDGEEGAPEKPTSPTVKAGSGEKSEGKSISDLYSIMEQVNEKLGTIANSSDKISKYVDEIRGDSPLKKKSWLG